MSGLEPILAVTKTVSYILDRLLVHYKANAMQDI